jgi:hypothetical protein
MRDRIFAWAFEQLRGSWQRQEEQKTVAWLKTQAEPRSILRTGTMSIPPGPDICTECQQPCKAVQEKRNGHKYCEWCLELQKRMAAAR